MTIDSTGRKENEKQVCHKKKKTDSPDATFFPSGWHATVLRRTVLRVGVEGGELWFPLWFSDLLLVHALLQTLKHALLPNPLYIPSACKEKHRNISLSQSMEPGENINNSCCIRTWKKMCFVCYTPFPPLLIQL